MKIILNGEVVEAGGGGSSSYKPTSISVVLTAAGWENGIQMATVNGVSADETSQLIQPVPAVASQSAYYEAGVRCIGQATDRLTFKADATPAEDLTVYVVILEVAV